MIPLDEFFENLKFFEDYYFDEFIESFKFKNNIFLLGQCE